MGVVTYIYFRLESLIESKWLVFEFFIELGSGCGCVLSEMLILIKRVGQILDLKLK